MTKVQYDATKREEFYAQADQAREQMQQLGGVQIIHAIETIEGEVTILARYETEDQANAAAPQVQEILSGMARFFKAPPSMKQGPVTWVM